MTLDKTKAPSAKNVPVAVKNPPTTTPPAGTGGNVKLPPLFRPTDWAVFAGTTLLLLIAYFLTQAPNVTLQDSGEECVGSLYAGVPHPPGYPIWTIITWLFTVIVPFGNVAWRVSLVSALSASISCGLIGLMVSRGSSMLLESLDEFKDIDKKAERAICVVSGWVAALLFGFNGFLWSQAVIVEVYPLSTLSLMMVMVSLFRWVYAPNQHRYLYLSWFWYGVCFNNHQSLLVCAMSIEVVAIMAQPKIGRDLLLGNTIIWILVLILREFGMVSMLRDNLPLLIFFNAVGVCSMVGFLWLWIQTKQVFTAMHWGMACFFSFLAGAMFYLYMPLASMSNPPMNWGYARTVGGFFHVITRGQYERVHPTTDLGTYFKQVYGIFTGAMDEFNFVYLLFALIPLFFLHRLKARERAWMVGVAAFYITLGPILLILLNPGADRQSVSLNRPFFTPSQSMISMFVGYGITFLTALLIVQYERWRKWVLCAFSAAAAFALYHLVTTWELTPYYIMRYAAIFGLVLAVVALLIILVFRSRVPLTLLLPVFIAMPAYSVLTHWSENEQRGHMFGYWFGHDMFMPPFEGKDKKPIYPDMAKDAILFGGTDPGRFCPTYMIFCESFIPPKDRTDPKFDRRDVYIITQNALADGTYLNYIRAHYFRSQQIDPPFFSELLRSEQEREKNLKTNFVARMLLPLDRYFLDMGDGIEKKRRTDSSMFTESDFTDLAGFAAKLKSGGEPAALTKYLKTQLSKETQDLLNGNADSKLARALAKDLNAMMDKEYEMNRKLNNLRRDYAALTNEVASLPAEQEALKVMQKNDPLEFKARKHRVKEVAERMEEAPKDLTRVTNQMAEAQACVPFYTPERFKGVELSDYIKQFIAQNPQLHSRIRLSRLLLEESFPKMIAKSLGGVYPDREIYTPSPEDSSRCFAEYMQDAQERLKKGQLKPGEDVRQVDNRVQVSGQVAVMAINGLLTKVIFENNPNNEFYVEESFPLDWMFPHLTPYGVIMKINRKPVREFTQDILDKDHDFWSQYSERLIGNWITYDTPVKDICAFAEKTYLRHDYTGFKGDSRFVRDDDAQKAFSKLRSSIGGLYAWRIDNARSEAERQRVMKEAEFTFKQAFAFCPYSPEALYRFINILLRNGRVDDASQLARTAYKLDTANSQLEKLVEQLDSMKKQQAQVSQAGQGQIAALEAEYRARPNNVSNAIQLANAYGQMGQADKVRQVTDVLLTSATNDPNAVYFTVQVYSQLRDTVSLEKALENWARVNPSPESLLDLAAIKCAVAKQAEALEAVRKAVVSNNQRLAANPQASNMMGFIRSDTRLGALHLLPEFKAIVGTNT